MYALNDLGLESFPGLEWNDFRSGLNHLYGFSAVGIGFDGSSGPFSDWVFRCPSQQEGRSMPDSPQDLAKRAIAIAIANAKTTVAAGNLPGGGHVQHGQGHPGPCRRGGVTARCCRSFIP